MQRALAFATSIGRCSIVYAGASASGPRRPLISAIRLQTEAPGTRGPHPAAIRALALGLRRALAGKQVAFSLAPLDLAGVPPFHAAVYRALARVPFGATLSYGELAARAGRPGAARAVGQAMARNPFAIVIPCHRVIQSGGGIGGYGCRGGVALKRRLLDAEARTCRLAQPASRTPRPVEGSRGARPG